MNSRAMAALREVAVAAGHIRDEAGLARLVVERARVIARGDAAVLRWFDPAASSFRLVATSGTPTEPGRDIASSTPTAIREAFQSGQPVIVNDYGRSGKTTSWGLTQRIRAQIAVPLMVDGRPVGTLAVLSFSGRRYAPSDAAFLSLVAALVAPTLEALRLTGEVSRQKDLAAQVYDALGVNVIVYDRSGRPIHYNSAAKAAWQNALSDPSGERDHRYPTYDASGEPLAPDQRPFAQALATKGPVRSLVVGFDIADQRRWALVDAVPVLDSSGEVDVVITSTVDITEVKEAQALLGVIIEAQRQIAGTEVDFDRMLSVLSEQAVALTGASIAAVLLPEGDELVVKAAAGDPTLEIGFRLPVNQSLAGLAFRTGTPQSVSDAKNDDHAHAATARAKGIGAMVSTPLVTADGVIGVLQLVSYEAGALDETDVRTLEMISGFAAAAYQRASTNRRLSASEHRVRAVMDSAPDPIVVFNSKGDVVDFNPAAEKTFLVSREEIVGQSAMVLLAPKHIEAFQRWHRAGTEANSHEYAGRVFESTGRRGDGSEFPMEIVVTDLPEETRLVAAFIRDLTLREAQRESEAKSRLMAMMNHEVRTPLNSILGFARLLKDPKYGRLTDKQTRYVSNIESSGNDLLELVNESLDLARLDIGGAQIEPARLGVASVLEQAADQVRPQAESKGLVLKVEPAGDLIVNSDRRQLAQVLLNLLSNAIRHTQAGGVVTLSAIRHGESVCICVADTGGGISASDQAGLFEEFFQASNHAPGGIGLGLAISRRLIQRMGGTIEVESELGRGSTFTLRLPAA